MSFVYCVKARGVGGEGGGGDSADYAVWELHRFSLITFETLSL